MLLSNSEGLTTMRKIIGPAISMLTALFVLSACQFQPLYGTNSTSNAQLNNIAVGEVDTRTAQQVRNHLLFLLNGGNAPIEPAYRADLRISTSNKTLANVQNVQDRTTGSIEVSVSYDLINLTTLKSVAKGSRRAKAAYDRTRQSFANTRAERDAENRAAKEAAEAVRFALASDLSRIGAPN
ncbi:MAG: hypothetical protein JKY83_09450 [Rhizobiaceae bacterium]|nr:hypothetical protein [Rhizobiaceae bacterium]